MFNAVAAGNPIGAQLNMSMAAGDFVNAQITLANAGVVMNLTGYSAKMSISMSPIVELTTVGGGLTIPTPTQGQVQINIATATSALWTPGTYKYDLWLISSGNEYQYLTGAFTVTPSVSPVP